MAAAQHSGRRAALLASALAVVLLAAAPAPAFGASQSAQWSNYIKESLGASAGANGAAASALQNVLTAHTFQTPLQSVLASNVYSGGNARLRRVVSDLLAGKHVNIVAIGGMATNGTDASDPGRNDYFASFVSYLAKAFPGASVKPVRSSVGLAPSGVVAACLDKYLPKDADLVLLEMTANDGAAMDSSIVAAHQPRAYEALVRSIMSSDAKPALILTHTMPPGMGNGTRPFYLTPESPHYAAVAGYYDLPSVSMRNALWRQGKLLPTGTMSTSAVVADDGATPTDAGHAALADALVLLTQRTAQDLQLLPYGEWDTKSMQGDVPSKTMYGGVDNNRAWTLRNATCGWVHNATVSKTGGCPSDMAQMCGLDYTNWDNLRKTYAASVTEVFPDNGRGKAALIGGVVGGVVAFLGAVGGLIGLAVVRQKRRAAAEDAAWAAKFGGDGGLPITASANNNI